MTGCSRCILTPRDVWFIRDWLKISIKFNLKLFNIALCDVYSICRNIVKEAWTLYLKTVFSQCFNLVGALLWRRSCSKSSMSPMTLAVTLQFGTLSSITSQVYRILSRSMCLLSWERIWHCCSFHQQFLFLIARILFKKFSKSNQLIK